MQNRIFLPVPGFLDDVGVPSFDVNGLAAAGFAVGLSDFGVEGLLAK